MMRPVGLAAIALLCVGCLGGGSSAQRTYYSLTYPMEAVEKRQGNRYPIRLLVRRFDAALAYEKQEIVYRQNPFEFSYYNFRVWSAKPAKLVQGKVMEHLRRARLVAGVDERIGDQLPDYELQGEVLALEELDSTKEIWFAHLAMRLTLVRFSDRQVVWTYEFDEQERVHERSPVHVVRVLSRILEEQLTEAVAQMDTYFATVAQGVPLRPRAEPVAPRPEETPKSDAPDEPRPKARLLP